MTFPTVTEVQLAMEPVTRDSFGDGLGAPRPVPKPPAGGSAR